ncbi:SGNH/GDSL hydrolase family protein [bacterium]|nr:SGNH/GDSL hydrolase family protein [bacterium]
MEKYRILCFGDSLTWGFDPEKFGRIDEDKRWTGALQKLLGEQRYKVIEEGQNGRTIATEDPAEGEKNGLTYIIPCLESQKPLNLMILMLGTNDMKNKFAYSASDIAGEMQRFLEKVQTYNRYRFNNAMKILLIAPPLISTEGKGSWMEEAFDYDRAAKISAELVKRYRQLAKVYGCSFLDASKVIKTSPADGVHIDAESGVKLAQAIYDKLKQENLL